MRDNRDGTFDLVYTLTKVDVSGGQTLELTGEANATEEHDFIAQITDSNGAGNIVFSAGSGATGSGTFINVGYQSGSGADAVYNDYSGKTTVTDGTTVKLIKDSGFGDTSELLAQGNVTLSEGVKQTIHGIDSTGSGTITLSSGSELTLDANGSQTINNIIAGSGSLVVDLADSGNGLVFNNSGQGESFTGNMTLSNGRFSMSDGSNASFAANAGIVLGSGSTFDLGSGSQNIKDLTVNTASKLESSALVIGSQKPAHTISGSLTLNANTSLTLNDISVADDLSLVDYDGSTHVQQFISAGTVSGTGSIAISGGQKYQTLGSVTLAYSQGSEVVAETVWSISDSLTQSGSGFDVNVELSEIKLINNTVISGSGTGNELSALISNSTQSGSHSLQFSLADGATSADFLVNHANGNTYSGSTTVDSGVSVTLGVNSGFGNTSNLIVKEGGTVKLNDGFSQVVGGLSGTGTVNLAGTGSVLTLTQNESAAIGNLLSGNGTFEVNLSGSGNQLSFTNSGSSGFAGTVDLSSGFLVLEGATTTQSVMDGASLVLGNSGVLKVEGTASYQAQIGSLSLDNGSRLELGAVDFGEAADRPQLLVSNGMTISGSVTLSVGGINLDGTTDILTASSTGLRQALVTANDGITNNGTLAIVADDLDASEIRNSGSSDVAAYGVWTPQGNNNGVVIDEKTIYASLKLNEIQLALDNGEGLLLDLSGQSSASLDAKLTNYDETSGDITFSGAGNLALTNSGNEFTGGVYVKSKANVTLGEDSVLGSSGKHTSLLDITGEGSQINLNGTKQYVGSINATVDGALTGSGSLTVDGANQRSTITGSNTGLSADITLSSGHTLAINNVASIGISGILTVADKTKLQISGASEGTFTKQLTGGGDIFVDASTFTVSGANSGFTGTWHIAENAQTASVTVSGTAAQIDASIGSGATVALGSSGGMSLVFSETNGTLTIDDVFTGAGQLTVSGTTGAEEFGFEAEWNQQPGFSGTLALNHIGMQVGGADGSVAANNASNLSNADLILNNSTVTVNGNVDTFDRVTVAAGSSGTFTLGGLGFSAPDSTIAGISQLSVGSFELNAGQTLRIQVSAPAANGDLLGSVAQTNLISGGMSPFQTLISTDSGISLNDGTVEDRFLLVDADGNEVADSIRFSQQINDAEGTTVASGYYSIALGLNDDSHDLGIGYTLEQIDILSTLTLYEEGTVEAQITSNSAPGNLTIASGGNITLSNSKNNFTGDTTIAAGGRLVAHEQALGDTDDLFVSGTYVNSGANAVNRVAVDGSGQLTLNADLTLKNNGTTSEIFGAITGNGDLLVNQGTLSVNENVGSSGYTGVVELGETNGTNGTLVLNGAEGLDSGSIVFNTAGSKVQINDSNDVLFSNEMLGQGIISVNLSGNETNGYDFAFGSTQNDLENGSFLILDKANFDLTASDVNVNDDVAQKLIISVNQGSTLSNDGTANKTIAGLNLYGGTVDMGVLESGTGQISLNNGTLTIGQGTTNTIVLDSQAQTSESGDRTISSGGQELLAGGLFDLTIFENVASVSGPDGSNVLGTSDADGNQSVSGLVTNSGFSGTSENLFQDADDDGTEDFVATMTRDSGSFFYNANSGNVFLQYSFKEINLLWTDLKEGLTIDATGRENAALSAHVTGGGNLRLGGTLTISGSSSDNDYTGRTYVLEGASVTVAQDSGFGVTKELNIADGAVVTMLNNVSQTVASLTGTSSGTLTLGDNAAFTIDNGLYADSKLSSINIGTTISGGSGATFAIDGDGVAVNFVTQSNLSGATFKLLDAQFAIADSNSRNYLTSASSNDFVLGSGADVMVTAGDTPYKYNELTFAGGELSVNGVTLASGSTGAIIHTEFLDLSQKSTLSVSADIDENFDILVNDSDSYSSTLIAFDNLSEKGQLATPISGYATSAIDRNNDDVAEAYVGWSGQVVWSFEDESNRSGPGSVGIEYQVQNLQLALDSGAGLVISTTHSGAATEQSTLTATITDYQDTAGHITFSGGEITIGGTGTNDYRGETFIDSGKVTLAKNSGFGQTEKLTIEGGGVDIAGFSQTLGALSVDSDASISGSGSLTLGSAAYSGTSSTVSGVLSNITGTVSLTNGHTLTMNQAEGLGASGTFSLETGTTVYVKGDQNTTDTRGNFSKAVTGDGTVVFDNSTNINITGNNSEYGGSWVLQHGSTVFVSGNETLNVDAILGNGGEVGNGGTVRLSGTSDILQITQSGGAISLDNVFAGSGRLEVLGTGTADAKQSFGFRKDWEEPNDFDGTLAMSGFLDMTVGGDSSSVGAYNAANLAYAGIVLGADSTVTVAQQNTVVNTFDQLAVNGGTLSFGGTFGLGASTSELGQLQVGSLSGSGDIALSIPSGGQAVAQTIDQNNLINIDAAGDDLFQALVTVESGTASADRWTLNGSEMTSGSGLRQAVNGDDSTTPVAYAKYDYQLTTGDVSGVGSGTDNALGIGYDLTAVDIVSGQTLTLSTSGSLGAIIENSSGHGNLAITGQIVLTGENTYSGETRVSGKNAKLTVGVSGLGETSFLELSSGAEFVNSGANAVGYLTASDAVMTLDAALTVKGTSGSTIDGGTLNGTGALNLVIGGLTVTDNVGGNYSGLITLGDSGKDTNAELTLSGTAGLGTGMVAFATSNSKVAVNGSASTTLANTYRGNGVIDVDLGASDSVFAFNGAQGTDRAVFTGELRLSNATYNLYAEGEKLAGATLTTENNSVININTTDSLGDRNVGSLHLNGGQINFGELAFGSDSGQIVISETGDFGIRTDGSESNTVIDVSLADNTEASAESVFDANADKSILLIQGFDAQSADLTGLNLGNSKTLTQDVIQTRRGADNDQTAVLTYASGALTGTEQGIEAGWKLTQIELTDASGKGLLINASGESGQSGSISALISGAGNIEFGGGTIKLDHANTYEGQTTVSNNATLELGQSEALGNTSLLNITSGTVAVNATQQTIGSLQTTVEGAITMVSGGRLELAGNSSVSGANSGIESGSTIALATGSETLTINDAESLGLADISLGNGTTLLLSGIASGSSAATFDNAISGASGTVALNSGALVEFTSTANGFGTLHVYGKGTTAVVNDMQENVTALGNALVNVDSGSRAELNGSDDWTLNNALAIAEGGELALSAGGSGNAFNFSGSNQTINGRVTLTDLMLTLDGHNEEVLGTASVVAGSNSHIHVAKGAYASDLQQVKDFTLSSGAEITFDGRLGMSGVGADVLGQLDVDGTLTLESGSTVHVNLDPNTGSSSSVDQEKLVGTAASGSFQDLITAGLISGSAVSDDGTVSGIALTDSNGNALQTVRADIKNGSGTVAVGTFGSSLLVSGSSFGVRYGLQAIDIVGDLTISESGSFSAKISSTSGTGSLTVSAGENLTLTGENDYTVATMVTGILTADKKALGNTKSLTISNGGQFINAGANEVGDLESSGKMTLNELLTVTNAQDGESHVSGTLAGNGGLMINSGSLVSTAVSDPTSGYTGTVTLGTSDTDAHLTLEATTGAQIGSGTIEFAHADSSLTINTSGASVLGNFLSGAGLVTVSGTNGESFAFKKGQQGEDVNFAGALTLANVQYDFTTDANDILDDVSLTVNNGTTLVLNDADDTATRKIKGLSLNGGRIDFGTIGNGSGHIDLQGQSLSTSTVADTTFSLETDLADRQDASGSAAFDGVIDESVLLIGNVAADTPESVLDGLAFEDNGQAFTRDLTLVTEKGTETTARIHGKLGGLVLTGNADGTKNVVAGLENQSLELLTTYNVRDSGSIALKIFGSGSLAVYDELTLTNGVNSYTGDTTVSGTGAVLTLGADGALGQANSHTGKLSVTDGAKVDFGSTSQTIGSITAEGTDALVSADQTNGKLTIADGGTVSGVNSGFHTAVELSDGSADLTLTNVDALGQASITTLGSGTDLVLSGADGEFDNIVAGSGGVSIEDGANVTLKGDNTFDGSLKVDGSSSVAASGNVFSHIGDGSLELEGSADFTQTTFADEHPVWTWNRTVNGSGNLSLSTDGAHELVLESGFANFAGTLSLGDLSLSLSSGGRALQSLETFSDSAIKHLVLESGADLHLDGETTLTSQADAFDVTMKSGGSFVFEGIAVPGAEDAATNTTHLTVDGTLKLEKGFELSLSTQEGAKVDPTNGKSLLEQDDDGMTIDVIAANDIQGDVSQGKVTLDGGGDTKFEIVNAEGTTVADGYYGFDIVSGSSGRLDTISLEYKLDRVAIRGGETLELKGDGDASLDSNTLKAEVTGSGDLSIAGNVTLDAANSYTGETIVTAGSKLYANENALGTVDGTLSAVTSKLRVEEGGEALINGFNTVEGLEIKKGGTLTIGLSSGAVPENPVMLTLKSDESAGSRLDGTLNGTGTIKVVGSGDVDDDNPADLTIVGSQGDFLGDLVLDSGAWIDLAANSLNIFGSSSSDASNRILVSEDSLLTIHSNNNHDASFGGVFENGLGGKGGRIEVTLASADNDFTFSDKQAEVVFTGTFALEQGTIDLGNLYSTTVTDASHNALDDATLELGANGKAILRASTSQTSEDTLLGGLTMRGGTIEFGSINYEAGDDSSVSGAHASHIDLGGDGILDLYAPVTGDDGGVSQSTITIAQNETNRISDAGSELLAADDGTSIVLIHGIGSLYADGTDVTDRADEYGAILNDYLHLENDAAETQLLEQAIESGESKAYAQVAEVVRTFADELTFGKSNLEGEEDNYAVSLGYSVDRVGLLHQTADATADNFEDKALWQGLTITTSENADRNTFEALITDASDGLAGNLVLKGNTQAAENVLTISGETNTYTGKTWVTAGANIAFGANSAFGSTEALRVDSGSTVDFGTYDQTVGGLFALGDNALQSDEGSFITVTEDAVIRGGNEKLIGNITFEGNAEINNAVGLGTGTVTLAGNGSQLEINGASGDAGGTFANTLVGGENTSVQIIGSDIALGTDQLENYEGSFNLIKSELDLSIKPAESDETVLGNVITTDVNSTLSASLGDGNKNFIFAEGSKVAGTLTISNGAFNLSDERNLSALDKTDLVIGGAGRLEIASDIGAENVDNLTLNTGSIIAFSGGGTPGSAGYDDSKGHLDLGDGTLTVNGNIGVEVDVGMVNADLVEDAKHDVSNLPLTAQDVLTADQGGHILANLVEAGKVVNDEGSFTLTVTGGEYDPTNSRLEVGIFNDGSTDEVAKGIYDYTVRLTEDGLNLSYGLTGVKLIKDQTLSLKGYAETDDIDNTLSIAVTGDGSLSIDAGTITLTGQNGYKGATTVAGGATLVTGIGGKALGETSSLNLVDTPTADGLVGARAEIHGDETVGALNIDANSTLALGAAAENDRTEFTIKNTAGVESTVHGQITGGRDSLITVIGNAESSDYDLVVTTANDDFYGDVTLQDAYVRLESINSFGSEGILRLDTTSTLEINSNADDAQTVTGDDGTVYTYHKFENLISGDGTVRVALDDADDYFDFSEEQYKYPSGDDQAFTGTLELAVGKFRFTDRKADVLESVHVKLDGDATLDISSDTSETTDRTMRGLTLAGGTLEFGSLALDREHAEARATHIKLVGNDLNLEDADRQVEISFRQDATNYISDAGSEVVNAADGDGSKIVLIHDIGNLYIDGTALATSENAQESLQDYLKHELADNAEDQILHQSIAGAGQEADVQQVARVDREFGDFGYADMSDQNLGNALYLGYEINSIELLYRGSNDEAYGADGVWKGLTVSTSDLSNQLKAQLTGQGNLVVTGGTGGTLLIGDASTETEYNNYTGRTWVTGNAKVEFAEDNAFGNTSHLRVDVGSSVNLGGDESGGGFSQTVGSLVTYDENALIGGKDASLTVTGSAQIAGNNSGFYGNLIFDTEQVTTGTVTDVEGLGKGDVYIGENYQLQITDLADASGGSVLLENDLSDVNGEGGLLQVGSGLSKPDHESTTIIAGNNSNFSGDIRVEDGWSISAEVGEGEDIAHRLGTGSLSLVGDSSATIDFGSSDVEWNHNVDGRGTLNVTTDADRTVSIGSSGLGSGFEGTFTVGGGRFELADNADKLGNGNLAASGGDASIIVSGEESVKFGNNLTITGSNNDRGQLVFEDSIKLSDNGSPELIVDGNLTLNGAHVTVSVDGELEAGQGPGEALDMSSITMADEGTIEHVIAEAGLIEMSNTTLSLENVGSGNQTTVDIYDGGQKVATGTYDFGLAVSTDRTELGLSYKLIEVAIDEADTLLGLQGAVSGSTSAADWTNASEFSANITGAGGISLVNGNLTLTGAGNTYHGATVVYDGAVLTVESSLGNTSLVTVAEGGRLVNASDSTKAGAVNVAGRLDLEAGSKLSLKEGGESSITGSITGSGNLELLSNASVAVTAGSGYEAFTGSVTMEEGAEYALSASNGSTVIVRNSFADSENSAGGTVRFDKASGSSSANYSLAGSAVGFTGTFELGDNVVVSANSIKAIGGKGSELLITTGKVGDEIDKATLSFEYDDELVGQNDSLRITQGMTEGITFEKSGDGVVDLSDNAMGAGKVDVKEGGVLFGTSDRKSAYDTALEIAEDAWAAGFGGVSSLKIDLGGSLYVGGRFGYNSVLASTAAKAANEDPANNPSAVDNTVKFEVTGGVTNAGTIYVGNKNADGSAPADGSSIGNELVINGDYNVTASDKDGVGTGGIFDMNAIIAGDDSIADHVTITGKINGNGYVDVNYDSTVSTGGTLEYLGLVKVVGGDDGDSLRLKDTIKIGDLWYRLMWSSDQNEYYLQSSVTDPGDKLWDTEDVENVNAGTRSALAFMQAQAFDLSLRGHLGETLYVDPVTGEQRKSSFWMVQRGDWTKFSNASGQMDADGNLYTTHLGTDLFKRETDGATFRWGVLAGFADGDFDVSSNVDGKTSKGSFRGYSAGLYMTAESKAESGPFLGLQLRWNRFDSEVGQDDYDVNGLSLTAEASWDQLLSKGITDGGRNYEWRLEPHVRAYWTNFGDPDDWTSSLGETYSSDFDNGLLVRVGARTKIQTTLGTGPAWQAYAEANWVYNNGDYSTTMSTKYGDVTSTQNGAEFAEFRLGLEAQFTTNVNVWLEGHHQTGSDDYESTGAMFGFKYMW